MITSSSPRRRPALLAVAAGLLALVVTGASVGAQPAVAGAAPARAVALAAPLAAPTAAPEAAATAARPRAGQVRRACHAQQRRVAKRVAARVEERHGEQAGARAGRKAGRQAFRRCLRAATTPTNPTTPTTPITPGSPTTPASGPATPPAAPGDLDDPSAPDTVENADECLPSIPDPGQTAPVQICFTVVRPAGSSATSPVPMVLHSHGWGGSRTTDPAAFAAYTSRGYGVLSFDQRGFGESGGQAYVENPDVEGVDVTKIVARIADLPWVQLDAPGDPRLGAIGGSYGGGYQFLTAFETREQLGVSAIDAMAPEITWHDLQESLAPSGVTRTAWAAALTAGALPSNAMPAEVVQGLALGLAQGSFPDSLAPFFEKNGPRWQVAQAGRGPLDVPMLFGQGTTDGLFPLEQGLQNFASAITPQARARSIFVGYNGGHVLPAVLPAGISLTSDPCSAELTGGGTFQDLTLRFFDEQLRGRDAGVTGYGRYHLATPTSTCLTVDSVDPTTLRTVSGPIVNTVGPVGAPVVTEVASGPITLAGTPYLEGLVTAPVPDSRLFLGLATGTSPLDARLIQNNTLPLRTGSAPEIGQRHPRIDLPSVAATIPAGQKLFLLTSATQDTFVGMGSRVPGLVTIDGAVLHLPEVR